MAHVTKNRTKPPVAGTQAPGFTAPADDGRTVRLSDFKGKIVVLYFYPRDNTPGCTTEACGFRDDIASFKKHDIVVLGVSPDSPDSHRKFVDTYELPFTLVADEDHAIAESYGVWQEKTMAGHTSMGVVRTTFVIDQDGKVAHVFEQVKPQGHDAQVLDWIRANLM